MDGYTIYLTPEPDGSAYNVAVRELPGCRTFGTTLEEALANAEEAISVYLTGEDALRYPPYDPSCRLVVLTPPVSEDFE
jgi:predicted RNase H-like HicB family nuclease